MSATLLEPVVSVEDVAREAGVDLDAEVEVVSDVDVDGVALSCCNKTDAACWTMM